MRKNDLKRDNIEMIFGGPIVGAEATQEVSRFWIYNLKY